MPSSPQSLCPLSVVFYRAQIVRSIGDQTWELRQNRMLKCGPRHRAPKDRHSVDFMLHQPALHAGHFGGTGIAPDMNWRRPTSVACQPHLRKGYLAPWTTVGGGRSAVHSDHVA